VSSGDGLGEGYGMLGQAGSGKLRVSTAPSKLSAKITKKYAILLLFVTCHLVLEYKTNTSRT
jgi:hypothetical protein